ncbi:MAG TPA: alpha/beta fold hydrolase [Candidatus Ozemobacteraceae bacterium]|nr:alpha/beta fold hydrolase [Candidatus Ozemobacteraceae bacterium]
MEKQQGTAPDPKLQEDLARVKKFVEYLQHTAEVGDRADEQQLASLGMARTPCRTVYTEGTCRLLEYEVLGKPVDAPPIFMVYSFINRWYILDLMPGHSFIEALSRAGYKVYLIDWGIPGPENAQHGLDYYLEKVALRAVRRVRRGECGRPLTLFGYCLGGTLAGMMAALHPEEYGRLVLLTTPLEFTEGGLLTLWTNKNSFDPKKLTDTFGCVPEKILHAPFPFLQTRNHFAKPRMLFENILNDTYLKNFKALDRWATDNVPFPGKTFIEIIQDCYQDNRLAQSTMRIDGKNVELKRINFPTLNIYATQDHVVSVPCAERNRDLLPNSKVTDHKYEAGHVSLTVAHPVRETVWKDTINWLSTN